MALLVDRICPQRPRRMDADPVWTDPIRAERRCFRDMRDRIAWDALTSFLPLTAFLIATVNLSHVHSL